MIRYLLYTIPVFVLAHSRADGVIQSMWDDTPVIVGLIVLMVYGYTWGLHMFLESFIPNEKH